MYPSLCLRFCHAVNGGIGWGGVYIYMARVCIYVICVCIRGERVGFVVAWQASVLLFEREPFVGAGKGTLLIVVFADVGAGKGTLLVAVFAATRHPMLTIAIMWA